MEEIIKKANELGLMIRGSDIYKKYSDLAKKVEEDSESKALLDEYIKLHNIMVEKEKSGTVIEVSEKQIYQEMSEKVSRNELLKEFIASQSYYMNMIIQIQNAMNEPEGEPISESKIIKPNNSG